MGGRDLSSTGGSSMYGLRDPGAELILRRRFLEDLGSSFGLIRSFIWSISGICCLLSRLLLDRIGMLSVRPLVIV